MPAEGVMVSYNYSDTYEEEKPKIITVSASGIKFSDRWVLSHGSMLAPLKMANEIHKSKGKTIYDQSFYDHFPEIYVTCEVNTAKDSRKRYLERHFEYLNRNKHGTSEVSYQMTVLTGRICHMWQCPLLNKCVQELLSSWTVGHTGGSIEAQTEVGRTLMSVFILIDLEDGVADKGQLRPLSELVDIVDTRPPVRGQMLRVDSTPFGCEAFINSSTLGTICAAVGKRKSLVLADVATGMGSEGAPVFLARDDSDSPTLFGMVVSSVAWWKGEWVGLTLVTPLAPVLRTKLRIELPSKHIQQPIQNNLSKILETIDSSIVLIRCGDSWGSGIHVGGGDFLTCSHVVRDHKSYTLSVFCNGRSAPAMLKFKSADDRAYDLALVYSSKDTWASLDTALLADDPPLKGETVVAVGYPYFNDKQIKDLKPTITRGQISNVSSSMIQTSCCVQSGFSGGAIFRLTGTNRNVGGDVCCQLLGVIVSNTKIQETNATHPNLNMAVPVSIFKTPLMDYKRNKDKGAFKILEEPGVTVQSQWKLMPYRSKL